MKANVYIDGFNLYYGIKKWPDCKWLDFEALVKHLFPNDAINRIRYFTAPVRGKPDPESRKRQVVFLRAVRDNPLINIHEGRFIANKVYRALVEPDPDPDVPITVRVWNTQEKGSDVNLATYLLLDAIHHDCEMAIVISNDSDLREPIRIVQEPPFNVPVWVVNPLLEKPKTKMGAAHHLDLTLADCRSCQLPDRVVLSTGRQVTRPNAWSDSEISPYNHGDPPQGRVSHLGDEATQEVM